MDISGKYKVMGEKTSLSSRMKNNYEVRTRQYLTRRTPTIIRLDGKAFHTYTKGLDRPFDEGLMEDMAETTLFLCQEIQGVKCGYTQSDEITLLLTDFDTFETQAWFDYQVQKIVSVAASIATAKFNQLRTRRIRTPKIMDEVGQFDFSRLEPKLAYFDARVFQIPEFEEVVNCFIWRQRDAIKNSIQMLAQSLFSQRDLHKKNGTEQMALCAKVGHPWEDLPINKQRGSFVEKITTINGKNLLDKHHLMSFNPDTEQMEIFEYTPSKEDVIRTKWQIVECPDFTEDRFSILKLLNSKS